MDPTRAPINKSFCFFFQKEALPCSPARPGGKAPWPSNRRPRRRVRFFRPRREHPTVPGPARVSVRQVQDDQACNYGQRNEKGNQTRPAPRILPSPVHHFHAARRAAPVSQVVVPLHTSGRPQHAQRAPLLFRNNRIPLGFFPFLQGCGPQHGYRLAAHPALINAVGQRTASRRLGRAPAAAWPRGAVCGPPGSVVSMASVLFMTIKYVSARQFPSAVRGHAAPLLLPEQRCIIKWLPGHRTITVRAVLRRFCPHGAERTGSRRVVANAVP